jgi:hypothetical protein
MSEEFWENYKHPLWQKKRTEILQRAGFKCEHCGSEEETLHVHHWYYQRDKKPWEYENHALACLCEQCHEKAGCNQLCIKIWLAGLELAYSQEIIGFLKALDCFGTGISAKIDSTEMAIGFGALWGLHSSDIMAQVGNDQMLKTSDLPDMAANWKSIYQHSSFRKKSPEPGLLSAIC